MKIDKVRWNSTGHGDGRIDYTIHANIVYWPTKENKFYLKLQNPRTKVDVEFNAIFCTEVVPCYGTSGPSPSTHRYTFGIVGAKNNNNLTYGGYFDYIDDSWLDQGLRQEHIGGVNEDVYGYVHRRVMISSTTNKEYRADSKLGIDLQTRIKKISTPLYLIDLLKQYKTTKKSIEEQIR